MRARNAIRAVVTLGDSYSSGLGSGDYYNDCDDTPTPGATWSSTVTVGGNDAGFADELVNCFLANCTGNRATLEARIDGLVGPLAALYDEIQAAAPGTACLSAATRCSCPIPTYAAGATP